MPQGALEFLKLILPNEGLKCAWVKEGKRHFFTPSFEALAHFISTEDALGRTVYHACASYKTSDSRKQTNVLGARAFWLDVDAGEGKPYADQEEAARAVLLFCQRIGCAVPLFVGSGRGIHPYWPLVESMEPARWTGYAQHLKRLCEHHNLHADAVRTADLASILRTPGTRNRKELETIVRWGGPVGPYRLSDLGALNHAQVNAPVRQPDRPGNQIQKRRSLIAGALQLYSDVPNYAEPIADQCRQVGELRRTLGRVAEPHWYAALGVLAHTVDGERFAHEWSAGHASYTRAETESRLDRARTFGPTTCEKFQGVNAKGCEGCPLKGTITSPIQLGRTPHAERPHNAYANAVAPEIRFGGHTGQLALLGDVAEAGSLPKLPGDFRWQGRSLTFVKESNEGEDLYEVVSTYPLYLKGVQTGEINGEQFGLRFGLELPNEAPKELVVSAETIFSSNGIAKISGKGAVIHDADLFKRYVREAVDMFNADNKLDKQFEQYGWKEGGSFLYGASMYTAGEALPIVGSGEVKIRNQWLGPIKGGDLAKWSRAANTLFTKGCEPQSFALLGSFAAPLMPFHSSGEGGSIISLVNDQSGSGKTTALEAVESVWGRKEGIRLTDDDTRVSKSLILGVLANLPVTWDELYNRDPENIREFVLMFTNGRDKMRGTQDGGLRHSKANWSTILTLASNNSIKDILSTNAGTDAPSYRVLEFETSIPKGIATRGDDLKRALRDNSGYAGHEYMRLLTQPAVLAFITEALPKWTDQVWKKSGLNNEHRFWVRTIASVMAASVLVNKLGILEFSTDRITDWAIEYVKGATTNFENRSDPSLILSQFLAKSIQATLVVATEWKPRTEQRPLIQPRNELQIRYERQTGRLYISEVFFRKWLVENSVPIRSFFEKLKEMGVLLRDNKRVTLGAGTDYASGQSTCYEIDGDHPAVKGGLREVVEPGLPPRDKHGERVEKYQSTL
jgi:hypothetical protein